MCCVCFNSLCFGFNGFVGVVWVDGQQLCFVRGLAWVGPGVGCLVVLVWSSLFGCML